MKRPCHRAKKRWRDVLKMDLHALVCMIDGMSCARTGRGGFICV